MADTSSAPDPTHASGCTYLVATAARIAPVPEWIAALLRPPAPVPRQPVAPEYVGSRQALTGLLRVVTTAPDGTRNSRLHWASCRMYETVRAGQLSVVAAEGMLLDAASAVQLPDGEARATVASARRAVLGG